MTASRRSRPNFLLFITDQHRADFLGCYGHPVLRTPHIDSIAARGTAFDRFYVASPVCMHPDSREVTILSGTWYTGYGETFDTAALKALPAGSFYTEPANVAHFVAVREPVIIQVSGTGPSGRRFVDPADNPK